MKGFTWVCLILILKYTFANDLNRDGVWVRWSADNEGIPANAVVGGYNWGQATYVIRAPHYQNGNSYRGVIVGKYHVNDRYASYPYYNREYFTKDFEVLTHTNYIWQNKAGQPNYLIPGGHDSGGNTIWVCRASTGNGKLPGKLHNGKCYIGDDGKEMEYKNWDTLKRRDNNL